MIKTNSNWSMDWTGLALPLASHGFFPVVWREIVTSTSLLFSVFFIDFVFLIESLKLLNNKKRSSKVQYYNELFSELSVIVSFSIFCHN